MLTGDPMIGFAMLASLILEPAPDWLVSPKGKASVVVKGNVLTLQNDLVSRTFRLQPNLACQSLVNKVTGEEMIRAVKPEAILKLDGKDIAVGGLQGQPNLAFLTPEWLDKMSVIPGSFEYRGYTSNALKPRMDWGAYNAFTGGKTSGNWPPKGIEVVFKFENPATAGIEVEVHYELYDSLPLFGKWVSVRNASQNPLRLDTYSHALALVEAESIVDDSDEWERPDVTCVSDYSFGGMSTRNSNKTIYWESDPAYKTQVNYNLRTPCDLVVRPPLGPAIDLSPNQSFNSFRSFLLLHDSSERERKGLAVRKMYRTLAPWVTENPIMMHLTSVDPKVVHTAIDQAAECGFEMIILSFGSGLNMEDDSPASIAKFKAFREYANSKGLGFGGYSLLASRSIDKDNDVVNPKPIFGNSPCLCSKWGQEYFRKVKHFIEATGFNLLEHDGSYPGDPCASTSHPGHRDLDDSQYRQYEAITELYRWCRAKGVFLNVPDNYFLAGSNKTGMGYRETNWSLPRAQQHIHARQNLFDGTWEKAPSMGWMFTPLVEYHGGGPEATIEPLKDHLEDYQQHLVNNFAFGAQSCYRGPRLYDSPETKAMVIRWVNWFKENRRLLESDVIHLRRANGRSLDGILHVDPAPKQAMAILFNPTSEARTEKFEFPLHYAGLDAGAKAVIEGPNVKASTYSGKGEVTVPARSFVWIKFSR